MPVYLRGLALQHYRGIGPEIQKLRSFREFNFFIGANNAGKSTILDYLSRYLNHHKAPQQARPTEQYRGAVTGNTVAAVGIPIANFVENVNASVEQTARARFAPDTVPKISRLLAEEDVVWIRHPFSDLQRLAYLANRPSAEAFRSVLTDQEIRHFWHILTGATGGGIEQHWIPQIVDRFLLAQKPDLSFPDVQLIPAIRQIGAKAQAFTDFSGRGLIDKLAEIQSPDHDMRHERESFDHINEFLQTVTGRESAQIEVPHNREHILVHMDNKVLPLASLGTGIHEVIMIAAFCTLSEGKILCIEEPEIHLHPLLQRKLVSYLKRKTNNQYFVATHSASFIDTPDAAIFHVTNDGIQTYVRESILRNERFAICVELGTKASDILQSNAVVWVEGPSDRIYLRHWIKALASELIEGIHYSIMFYGGRLLSHLSADDSEISEFIALRSLNRNLAIIMDSDKGADHDNINETKSRVMSEFAQGPGVAWVTKGREIENYINYAFLQDAVSEVHPQNYGKPAGGGTTFEHSLYYVRKDDPGTVVRDVDKVKVARVVCARGPDFGILDLRERVEEIISMIRVANA